MDEPSRSPLDGRSVLVGLSTHLDCLADRIGEVEEALCGLLAVPQTLNAHDAITKFQTLDFVRQALEDCALLVHHLAVEQTMDNAGCLGEAQKLREKLKLEATQNLLSPKPISERRQPPAQDCGIDLF